MNQLYLPHLGAALDLSTVKVGMNFKNNGTAPVNLYTSDRTPDVADPIFTVQPGSNFWHGNEYIEQWRPYMDRVQKAMPLKITAR